ncbi:MAG: aminopeptidase P family protein, partial [Candidatus Riflebacteria bacterium]|nr:aminopeptidase P family protein [Candidatus Riflebacteria bacterium]
MTFKTRIKNFKQLFSENYKAFLITNLDNVRYLSGFTGSNGTLFLTPRKTYLFTDFRYQEQSQKEAGKNVEIVILPANEPNAMYDFINSKNQGAIGFEKSMTVERYLKFHEKLTAELFPTDNLAEELRKIKTPDEKKNLDKAFAIADAAFAELMKIIKPGMTEIEVASHLEFFMKTNGSHVPSFDTIVASGENSSSPHAKPTSKKIKEGEMVKIDFGATYNGYHSDMTRTIFMGKATKKFKEIYDIVLTAQKKAIDAIKPGVPCKEIDAIAREHIASKGYGKNFGHGLGHAFGLQIHEKPALSQSCEEIVQTGHTCTVEPGIYIEGWGGIRIEDSFLVEEKGLHKFTKTPNKLLE